MDEGKVEEGFNDTLRMMTPEQIRQWIAMERSKLSQMVIPSPQRRNCEQIISVLRAVLGEVE